MISRAFFTEITAWPSPVNLAPVFFIAVVNHQFCVHRWPSFSKKTSTAIGISSVPRAGIGLNDTRVPRGGGCDRFTKWFRWQKYFVFESVLTTPQLLRGWTRALAHHEISPLSLSMVALRLGTPSPSGRTASCRVVAIKAKAGTNLLLETSPRLGVAVCLSAETSESTISNRHVPREAIPDYAYR